MINNCAPLSAAIPLFLTNAETLGSSPHTMVLLLHKHTDNWMDRHYQMYYCKSTWFRGSKISHFGHFWVILGSFPYIILLNWCLILWWSIIHLSTFVPVDPEILAFDWLLTASLCGDLTTVFWGRLMGINTTYYLFYLFFFFKSFMW